MLSAIELSLESFNIFISDLFSILKCDFSFADLVNCNWKRLIMQNWKGKGEEEAAFA